MNQKDVNSTGVTDSVTPVCVSYEAGSKLSGGDQTVILDARRLGA